MIRNLITYSLYALLIIAFIGCGQTIANAEENVEEIVKSAEQNVISDQLDIVFIDKENCCKCTKARTDETWAELQAALKDAKYSQEVKKLHLDTQAGEVEKYKAMRPIMVPPAIYFLKANGDLVEMLQGQVTKEQILKVLKKE